MKSIQELENICEKMCFKFKEGELIFPSQFENLSFIIMYPTDGFYLTKEQFNSIKKSLDNVESLRFFISDIEGSDSFINEDKIGTLAYEHRQLEKFDYTVYTEDLLLFDNAIYNKILGISVFQDYFAIVCGDEKFISLLKNNYNVEEDRKKFKEFTNYELVTNKNFRNQLLKLIDLIR